MAEHDDDRPAEWFTPDGGSIDNAHRSARLTLDHTGRPQRVHVHPRGGECSAGCTTWRVLVGGASGRSADG